jgi:hypothetical protein
MSPEEKKIVEAARQDWQEQCKRSFQGVPFRDKSAKECLARHKRMAGLK